MWKLIIVFHFSNRKYNFFLWKQTKLQLKETNDTITLTRIDFQSSQKLFLLTLTSFHNSYAILLYLESFCALKNLTRETYIRVMFSIYLRMVRYTSNLHSPNRPSCITHAKPQRDARSLAHNLLLNYSNTKYSIGVHIYIYLFTLNL